MQWGQVEVGECLCLLVNHKPGWVPIQKCYLLALTVLPTCTASCASAMRALLAVVLAAVLASANPVPNSDVTARDAAEPVEARGAIEKRSFILTCHDCRLSSQPYERNYMGCTCGNGQGGFSNTILDLNGCIGNFGGWLTWAKKYIPPFKPLPRNTQKKKRHKILIKGLKWSFFRLVQESITRANQRRLRPTGKVPRRQRRLHRLSRVARYAFGSVKSGFDADNTQTRRFTTATARYGVDSNKWAVRLEDCCLPL
jgi:hypothetical protein